MSHLYNDCKLYRLKCLIISYCRFTDVGTKIMTKNQNDEMKKVIVITGNVVGVNTVELLNTIRNAMKRQYIILCQIIILMFGNNKRKTIVNVGQRFAGQTQHNTHFGMSHNNTNV